VLNHQLVLAQLSPAILIVTALIILTGLGAGHALGGPDRATRGALALTAASRHIGFAIAAATAVAPQSTPAIVGTAILYFLLRRVLVIPYVRRMSRPDPA
jgi:BASS family bile acid:Na+ symporter